MTLYSLAHYLGDIHDEADWLSLLGPFGTPAWASCSKKFDLSSARESLLSLVVLWFSEKNSVASDGVLGVRCTGVVGILRLPKVELVVPPGRARPACSRCSVIGVS